MLIKFSLTISTPVLLRNVYCEEICLCVCVCLTVLSAFITSTASIIIFKSIYICTQVSPNQQNLKVYIIILKGKVKKVEQFQRGNVNNDVISALSCRQKWVIVVDDVRTRNTISADQEREEIYIVPNALLFHFDLRDRTIFQNLYRGIVVCFFIRVRVAYKLSLCT